MLAEQYLISLNFQAGSLPVSLAEQPKACSCCCGQLSAGFVHSSLRAARVKRTQGL